MVVNKREPPLRLTPGKWSMIGIICGLDSFLARILPWRFGGQNGWTEVGWN